MGKNFAIVLLSFYIVSFSTISSARYPEHSISVLSADGLNLMEPVIVPESEDGSRWWYTPSHNAHIHSKRLKNRIDRRISKKVNEDLLLPGDILPSIYALRIIPIIEEGNFTTFGQVDIIVECVKATSQILMNSIDITIHEPSITVRDLEARNVIKVIKLVDEQATREMITIQTETQLKEGKRYKISMKFNSLINEEKRGFFRSSYEEDGVKKWMAVTQFEATDARRAFPCFDEPAMKANFSIVIGRREPFKSASNMPLLDSIPIEQMPGYYWDYFQTSVKMSTYLVAFLVSELEDVVSTTSKKVPFRIWVRPELRNISEFSLNRASVILDYYEGFFGVNYSLPKQDLVAVPDFLSAMENWGLVTYDENLVLINISIASYRQWQSVLQVNAHELAHQWFGNLATINWWSNIWLHEGIAKYYEYYGANVAGYEFRMLEQFVLNEFHPTFVIDALETSRPMNFEVTTPSEIMQSFDAIAYNKGACIIQMCEDFLGWSIFNKGMTRYLNNNSYTNVEPDDLWQALQEQAEKDRIPLPTTVKEIMDTWTNQMGYPLINVTRDYVTGNVTVSQQRFLQRKNPESTDTHEYRWWVPLSYYSRNYLLRRIEWLSSKNDSVTLSGIEASPNDWLVFNYDQRNFYRVIYDETNYKLIADQLIPNHGKFSDNQLAQLLDDAFVLASAHMLPYKLALNLASYLKIEQRYVPWHAVLEEFDYIDNMLFSQPQYPDWKVYLTSLVGAYYNFTGFHEYSDSISLVYSRADSVTWACRLRIKDCVDNVKTSFDEFMNANETDRSEILSPNQKEIILRAGVELGGSVEWRFAIDQYIEKADTTFLSAATYSRDSSCLYTLLEMMLEDESGIRLEDVLMLFNGVASNPLGNVLATKFLITRWDDIEQSRLGTSYFISFFRYLCSRQNTPEQLEMLLKLRDDHIDILGNSNTIQQGIDIVEENIKWMGLHKDEIGYWLMGIDGTTTAKPTTTRTTKSTTTKLTTSSTQLTPSTLQLNTSTIPSTSTTIKSNLSTTFTVSTTPSSEGSRLNQINFAFFISVIVLGTCFTY